MKHAPQNNAEKSKLPWLIPVGLLLAGLVWLDQRPDSPVPMTNATPITTFDTAGVKQVVGKQPQGYSPNNPNIKNQNPLADLDLASLSHTIERPLFRKSRRPVVKPKKSLQKPDIIKTDIPRKSAPIKFEGYDLIGIISGDDQPIALLRSKKNNNRLRAMIGDVVDGWRVDHIYSQKIEIKKNGTKRILRLFHK